MSIHAIKQRSLSEPALNDADQTLQSGQRIEYIRGRYLGRLGIGLAAKVAKKVFPDLQFQFEDDVAPRTSHFKLKHHLSEPNLKVNAVIANTSSFCFQKVVKERPYRPMVQEVKYSNNPTKPEDELNSFALPPPATPLIQNQGERSIFNSNK